MREIFHLDIPQEQLVEFNQLAIEHANGHEDMFNRVMTKDNIALAALLQTKEACWENGIPPDHKEVGQHILVCSAHIHWDPEFCDVKLIQTMMLMEQLREITETCGHSFRPDRHKKGSDNVHLLLCAGKTVSNSVTLVNSWLSRFQQSASVWSDRIH